VNDLVASWQWAARTANVAHLRATDSLNWRNFALGGTSAILGAVVGLGIFATLQEGSHHLWVRIAAGGVAFIAAGLAALWKYLNYTTRADEHRKASRDYGQFVRQVDRELVCTTPITCDAADKIRNALDKIDAAAPNVSPFIWAWAVDGVLKRTTSTRRRSTGHRSIHVRSWYYIAARAALDATFQ
jgi:hypothetical protein